MESKIFTILWLNFFQQFLMFVRSMNQKFNIPVPKNIHSLWLYYLIKCLNTNRPKKISIKPHILYKYIYVAFMFLIFFLFIFHSEFLHFLWVTFLVSCGMCANLSGFLKVGLLNSALAIHNVMWCLNKSWYLFCLFFFRARI